MDIDAVHKGLGSAVDALPGIKGYPNLPGSINPPVFAPTEFTMAYSQTFQTPTAAGLVEVEFTCGVFTSEGDTEQGRADLLKFLPADLSSTTSIKKAIEADKTLGGVCKTLFVARVRGAYRLYEIGATSYLGAMIDVKVWG